MNLLDTFSEVPSGVLILNRGMIKREFRDNNVDSISIYDFILSPISFHTASIVLFIDGDSVVEMKHRFKDVTESFPIDELSEYLKKWNAV